MCSKSCTIKCSKQPSFYKGSRMPANLKIHEETALKETYTGKVVEQYFCEPFWVFGRHCGGLNLSGPAGYIPCGGLNASRSHMGDI